MDFADYQKSLDAEVKELPTSIQTLFDGGDLLTAIEIALDPFNLTMGEIGELCEIVRKLIVKELAPENFETAVAEKLNEDNRPRAGEIAFALNDQILTKLLPALGMKTPVIMKPIPPAPPPSATPTPESPQLTTSPSPLAPRAYDLEPVSPPARTVPLKKILPISPPPRSPYLEPISSSSSHPLSPSASSGLEPIASILEPATLSAEPIESLMKMTAGKVRERELEHRFARLPETLKEALRSVDSARKVVDIARRHGLHVDKIGELGAQTGLVIFGFTHPGEFLSRLKGKLNLSEDTAREIAGEINSEIFLKIREALKEVNGEAKTSHPETASSFPQPSKSQAPVNIPSPSPSPSPELKTLNLKPRSKVLENLPRDMLTTSSPLTPSAYGSSSLRLSESNDLEPTLAPAPSKDEILREIENPARLKPQGPVSSSPSLEDKNRKLETVPPLQPRLDSPIPLNPKPPPSTPPIPPPPKPSISKFSPSPSPLALIESETLRVERPSASNLEPALDIVEQKLSGPTVAPKSEKRYSDDPYREPIG